MALMPFQSKPVDLLAKPALIGSGRVCIIMQWCTQALNNKPIIVVNITRVQITEKLSSLGVKNK